MQIDQLKITCTVYIIVFVWFINITYMYAEQNILSDITIMPPQIKSNPNVVTIISFLNCFYIFSNYFGQKSEDCSNSYCKYIL